MSDADPILAGKHVLVVDDEPLLAYDLADLLQLYGARIAGTCMSLEEAEHQAEFEPQIDCAVLDIQLGDQEIWPCARKLKERGIPFLFVSALCGIRPLPDEFAGRTCLAKPVDIGRLRDSLKALLKQP